jgi:hypothetical protein
MATTASLPCACVALDEENNGEDWFMSANEVTAVFPTEDDDDSELPTTALLDWRAVPDNDDDDSTQPLSGYYSRDDDDQETMEYKPIVSPVQVQFQVHARVRESNETPEGKRRRRQ